jgi:hypothetical protein
MTDPAAPDPTGRATWGAASDLSRVLPTGTTAAVAPAVPADVGQPTPNERLVEFAAVTPPSGRRPVSAGHGLGRVGRAAVGLLLGLAAAFLLYTAWRNLGSL